MEEAARLSYGQAWLLLPRWAQSKDTNAVQRIEAGTASPSLLQSLISEYFDDIIRRAIIGQTLSATAEGTGMGSGVAELQGMTLSRIIKYDAVNLAETIQRDLLNMLAKYNTPGVEPGKFSFEVDTPNAKEVMGYAESLYDMGLPLDEDQLYKISQMSKPKPGGGIVSKLGSLQPAAVGGAPQGVPVAGEAGPQQNGQIDPNQVNSGQPNAEEVPAQQSAGPPITTVRQSRVASLRRLPQRRGHVLLV
jgi:phage gp29-like protein